MSVFVRIICVLWLSTLCNGQQNRVPPSQPTSYSGIVSQQWTDSGFTLGYQEYYDGTNQILRTEGRYENWYTVDVINFALKTWYRYTPNSCKMLQTANFPTSNSIWIRQSMRFFEDNAGQTKTYYGQLLARNVLCDVWQTNLTNPVRAGDPPLLTSYYFNANTKLPMRVTVYGYFNDTNGFLGGGYRLIDRTFDWVNLTTETTESLGKLDAIPSDICASPEVVTTLSGITSLPTYNVDAYNPSMTLPSLPAQFTAVWESKLLRLDGSSVGDSSIYKWTVDTINNRERVDCFPPGTCNPVTASTFITKYYDTYGIQWRIDTDGSCTRSRTTGMSATTVKSFPMSPLRFFRPGTIPNIATSTPFPKTTPKTGGRVTQRGIPADSFYGRIVTDTADSQGKKYDFTQYSYYYPSGWTFMGRDSKQIPARIFNTGTYTEGVGTTKTGFNDTWDIFLFIGAVTNENQFSVKPWGCDESDVWADDIPDETGSKAWIVAVVLLVLGVVGCVVWSIHKQRVHKRDWKQDTNNTGSDEATHAPQQLVEEE